MRLAPSALLLATTALALPAMAQDESPPQPGERVEQIVVTARKRAEKLKEVPMGITAISGRKLDERQIVQFADLVAKVPGLSVNGLSRAESQLTIRGENANGAGSTVAVYVDDSPFGSSNALANGSVVTGNFETFDLDRLEVLRGPQGTLYGATSEGGLLKFVTTPPELGTYGGKLEIGGQTVQGGNSALLLKGMANIPLGEKAALRIVAFDDGIPGYTNNAPRDQKAVDDGRTWGQRTSLLLKPTEALTVRLTAFQQQLNLGGFPQVDAVGAADPNNPPPNAISPVRDLYQSFLVRQGYQERIENYSGRLDYDFGPATLTGITSWGVIRQRRIYDTTPILGGIPYPPDYTTTYNDVYTKLLGRPFGFAQYQYIPLHKFTQEVRLTSAPSTFLDWQIGGFYTRETASIDQYEYAILLPENRPARVPAAASAKTPNTYGEGAVFAEATWHITPKLDFTAGGRLAANWQSFYEDLGGPLNYGATPFRAGSREGQFTYSVAARYHINADTIAYGRIATGYRPGGPNQLPPDVPPNVQRQYGSDTTRNFEIGLRSALWDQRLTADVAAFYINWDKIQLIQTVDSIYYINANGGTATSKGFEWAFGATPVDGLSLSLVGSYIDAYLTSLAAGVGGHGGDRLVYVPRWNGSIEADWRVTRIAGWSVSVGGTASYVGTRYFDFESNSVISRRKLPDYTQLDVRLSARKAPWFAEIYARNLTDERGITSFGTSGGYNNYGSMSVIQPLTVGFVASRSF